MRFLLSYGNFIYPVDFTSDLSFSCDLSVATFLFSKFFGDNALEARSAPQLQQNSECRIVRDASSTYDSDNDNHGYLH